MNDWNISDKDGEILIKKLLIKIFSKKKVNKEELPLLMKKMAKEENIIITKNNKKRNINNYIRFKYGNFNNMFNKFSYINNKTFLEKYKFPIMNSIPVSDLSVMNNSPNGGGGDDPYLWFLLFGLFGVTGMFLFFKRPRVLKLF